jgi:hypothetical protein
MQCQFVLIFVDEGVVTLKQMEQQIQYQDMIENSSHETPFNNGNKFPMGETPILIAFLLSLYSNLCLTSLLSVN